MGSIRALCRAESSAVPDTQAKQTADSSLQICLVLAIAVEFIASGIKGLFPGLV
jgi:hypothetical protein